MKTDSLHYLLDNFTKKLSSDHTPLIINIQARNTHTSSPRPLWNVDWVNFEYEIAHLSQNTNTTDNIDALAENQGPICQNSS